MKPLPRATAAHGNPGRQTAVAVALAHGLPEQRRPGTLGKAATDTMVFAWRALLKIKHTPEQAFDVILTPILFTVMFTYMFGGAVLGSTDAYLQYLLPGILVQTVMFTTVYTGMTLNQDIARGVFDRYRSLPIWRPAPIAGAILGDFVRYSASAVLVFAVGMVMGYRSEAGLLGMLAALVLLDGFAFGLGWVFTALALAVRTVGTVMTLSWLFLMPVTFVSNIYVDPVTMPGWLQPVVAVNPVTLITSALRGVLAGQPAAADIGIALAVPIAVTAVCAPITLWLYGRNR